MLTFLKIKQVDQYGFLGRDYHPEPSDEGKVGYLIGFQLADPTCECDLDCFTIRLEDDRKLEVMPHEIDWIKVADECDYCGADSYLVDATLHPICTTCSKAPIRCNSCLCDLPPGKEVILSIDMSLHHLTVNVQDVPFCGDCAAIYKERV